MPRAIQSHAVANSPIAAHVPHLIINEGQEAALVNLQSQGIPADEAEQMLVDGFFAKVLEGVPSERVQDRVRGVLDRKLGR